MTGPRAAATKGQSHVFKQIQSDTRVCDLNTMVQSLEKSQVSDHISATAVKWKSSYILPTEVRLPK